LKASSPELIAKFGSNFHHALMMCRIAIAFAYLMLMGNGRRVDSTSIVYMASPESTTCREHGPWSNQKQLSSKQVFLDPLKAFAVLMLACKNPTVGWQGMPPVAVGSLSGALPTRGNQYEHAEEMVQVEALHSRTARVNMQSGHVGRGISGQGVVVHEAEPDFVEDDNLEPGEVLVKAFKAFDTSGKFLCAGALVRRRSEVQASDVHDCWLGDSVEKGVDINSQIRGAELILDKLFLLHLQSRVSEFNVPATVASTTVAAQLAAMRRGFTREVECSDTGEPMLRFSGKMGLDLYQQASDRDGEDASAVHKVLHVLRENHEKECLRASPRTHRTSYTQRVTMCTRDGLQEFWDDLRSTDWLPLKTRNPWRNPCFVSSFLTAVSVVEAARHGVFVPFGVGPLLVLASSILYWHNPVKGSVRRTIDIWTVRVGLACQVLLAWRFCSPATVALPRLLAGYAAAMACYAWGRILTVRARRWAGAYTHCGVHVFANLGNLLALPFAINR